MSGEKSTVLRFESAPDNSKTMSGNPERSSNQPGQALCEVVLDAVWHAQQVKTQGSTNCTKLVSSTAAKALFIFLITLKRDLQLFMTI